MPTTTDGPDEKDLDALCSALLSLDSRKDMKAFLDDLLTPAETKAVAERWAVVRALRRGLPYRRVYEETGVSTATVTRVARCLKGGAGGYRRVLERLGGAR